jgi:hypothetical protein
MKNRTPAVRAPVYRAAGVGDQTLPVGGAIMPKQQEADMQPHDADVHPRATRSPAASARQKRQRFLVCVSSREGTRIAGRYDTESEAADAAAVERVPGVSAFYVPAIPCRAGWDIASSR